MISLSPVICSDFEFILVYFLFFGSFSVARSLGQLANFVRSPQTDFSFISATLGKCCQNAETVAKYLHSLYGAQKVEKSNFLITDIYTPNGAPER